MSRPETCPERRPVCKACHCFVDDHVPLQSTLHKWWCHGCADHCDGFAYDPAPPPAPRHWQHEDTGRVCECVDCPGERYHEVNDAFAEAHEKAMREKCGAPAPRDATPTDGDVIAWAVFKGDSYEWVHYDEAKARENERDGYRVVPLVPAAVSATGRGPGGPPRSTASPYATQTRCSPASTAAWRTRRD